MIVTNKKPKIAPLTEQYSINLEVILKIDVFVAQIIKAPNFDNFTTSDVRSYFKEEKQKNLIAKLNHYKAELLLNIGESEAYKELYSEFPELVEEIQPQFNKARDNNTRILGKIRAIEGLLEQDKSVEKI